jgi:hypothetical protein
MLKVAPVSTKYLSLVNSTVKIIKPAFSRKMDGRGSGMCGEATEPKVVRRQISFPTMDRAECTC